MCQPLQPDTGAKFEVFGAPVSLRVSLRNQTQTFAVHRTLSTDRIWTHHRVSEVFFLQHLLATRHRSAVVILASLQLLSSRTLITWQIRQRNLDPSSDGAKFEVIVLPESWRVCSLSRPVFGAPLHDATSTKRIWNAPLLVPPCPVRSLWSEFGTIVSPVSFQPLRSDTRSMLHHEITSALPRAQDGAKLDSSNHQ